MFADRLHCPQDLLTRSLLSDDGHKTYHLARRPAASPTQVLTLCVCVFVRVCACVRAWVGVCLMISDVLLCD